MDSSYPSNQPYQEDLNNYADKYLSPDAARSVDQKILAMVIDSVVPLLEGPKVLEMGYGDGAWTGRLIEQFGRSYIVDASFELLSYADTKYGSKVSSFHAYFEDFDPPYLFDTVLCTYVLEHVVDPVKILKQLKNWLNKEGLLLVIVPNATSLHRRLGVAMGLQQNVYQLGDSDTRLGHRRVYDSLRLESDLIDSGFQIESKMPMMFKPFPNSLMSHLNNDQLNGLFKLGDELPEDQRSVLAYLCRSAK